MATTLAFTVKRSAPELVAPSRATPRELRPLSDIDDQDGLRFYRSGLHFFRGRGGGGADPAAVVRRGLADALVHYYPVAGRISEVEAPARKLVVDCTGDGVVFVEADADVSLSDFGDVLCPPFPCYQELLCEPDGNCAAVVGRPLLFIQVITDHLARQRTCTIFFFVFHKHSRYNLRCVGYVHSLLAWHLNIYQKN